MKHRTNSKKNKLIACFNFKPISGIRGNNDLTLFAYRSNPKKLFIVMVMYD